MFLYREFKTKRQLEPCSHSSICRSTCRTGVRPCISATNHIGHSHIGHSKTISATKYGEFIWRHRVDTSLFRVGSGSIVNLHVKPRIRPIGQKEAYRPMSPVIEKMNVRFFNPANILLGYRYLLPPHSRHSIPCPA